MNALTKFGFKVVYSNGVLVHPVFQNQVNGPTKEAMVKIVLKKSVYLKPSCTKLVQAMVDGEGTVSPQVNWCGIMIPSDALAAN